MAEPSLRPTRRVGRGVRVVVRRTVSHTLTAVHYALNLGLLAIVGLLAYLLTRDDLPVPDILRGRIQRELAARGFAADFASARFDPTGKILVQDVTFAPERFGEPVLAAARVFAQFDRLALLAGQVEILRLDAEGLRLICPAQISPSGVPETLVAIASLRVLRDGATWRVPGLAAEIGPVRVFARGTYQASPDRPVMAPPNIERLLAQFTQLAPRVSRSLAELAPFTEPRLTVNFSGAIGQPWVLDCEAAVTAWRDPRVGDVRGARLQTRLTLGGPAPASTPLHVSAQVARFEREGAGVAENITLSADWLDLPSAEKPWPWQTHVTAGQFVHPKLTLDAPVAAIFPLAFPLVEIDVAGIFEGQTLDVLAVGDVKTRSGDVWLRGRAGPTWLERASTIAGRDVTYYATITEPPVFSAHAELAAGLRWQRVDFRLCSGPIVARGVPLDRTRVRGTITPERVEIDHLEFSAGDATALGTYSDDRRTRDYRFRLTGAARPLEIAPWFGVWWKRFWQDYQFNGAAPRFDVDAQGTWGKPDPVLISGSGSADDAAFRGMTFDSGRTRFFIRPGYYDLFEAALVRPEGRLDGEIQMRYRRGDPKPLKQTFQFTSTADLVELARIFGPGGEALLAPYRYQTPPAVDLAGTVARDGSAYDVRLDVGIVTGHEFRYHDFPLDALTTRVRIHNRQVELPEIRASYADGVLTGTGLVQDGRLTFDATLEHADFDDAVKIYSDFMDRNFPSPPEEAEVEDEAARESYGGYLTLALTAAGPIKDFKAYEGRGQFGITGADLYRIKVIGIFSDIFDRIGMEVGVLGFTDAASTFEVRRDRLHFPDLVITGKNARLEAAGDYSLRDRSLDFRVRMKPLRESTNFFAQTLGLLVNPLTDLLFESHVTGTLRKPEQRTSFLASRRPAPPPEVAPTAPDETTAPENAPASPDAPEAEPSPQATTPAAPTPAGQP